MVFSTAEIILFGIGAGARLYGQARQAYVEHTRERDLVLPLPGLDHESNVSRARGYFADNADGRRHVAQSESLRGLHAQAMADKDAFEAADPDGAKEYVKLYDFHRLQDRGIHSKEGLQVNEIVALNTIAQWRRGEIPHPTAIQRIAGTITEIGIDFFANGPGRGKLSKNSPTQLVLSEVLAALDDHSFVAHGLEGVIEKVFITTLDAIAETLAIVSGDPKMQTFVSGVAGGVVGDIQARLDQLPENERLFAADRLSHVGRAVFRSVVRNGAETVLENPNTFLGIHKDSEAAMAAKLGTIILDTVLPAESTGIDLAAVATGETLDELVKGALYVISEHPDLMGIDNPGIEKIVRTVSTELAAETEKLDADLFPEIARLVLESTAENMDALWKPENDGENLAVTAVQALLQELSRKPDQGKWRPRLTKSLVLNLTETVLDELAENPGLVTRTVSGKPAIEAAVSAIIASLAKQELDHFSAASAAHVIATGVKAAAERWELLEEIPGDDDRPRLALTAAIDAILASITGSNEKAAWRLTQDRILASIFDIAFALLAEYGADEAAIGRLQGALADATAPLEAGGRFSLDAFADDLEARLAA